MDMRLLLNVSIEISLILTYERTAFAFASVPDAVYETLAIATVVHKREREARQHPTLDDEKGKVHMPWY